ncbi:uncharacterized protein MYCGRDRAFT_48331 [Zymoseptoria tritici IPO323]|uniref:T6SS Phospholipase effector Tle1-like catalytic domain-containing protein n=1 Tax=Zymoseptoria tritici (strain CBS 115943 / IPO323) TaxID=336722 RepID=F9XLY5_ZYMTI|nr:uncharacterized protein MYCGRDRAFT_48331 [Zymoseptoria tritici IPO323]EGP84011.1 hypothetical protein MYCGRDRAFT_48331 [Zymoseptoria tritici IPO323]
MPKRLVLAIDGTWVNADNGYSPTITGPPANHTLATPSNVARLCRALKTRDGTDPSIEQIVYYQGGLGSSANWYSYVFGGYLGDGIDAAIREAYGFLANNYEDGDEIFLFGFSRGAFTARSVGGLIASIGLLTKEGMESFYPIFMDWEYQNDPSYVNGYSTPVWPQPNQERPKMDSKDTYFNALKAAKLTQPTIPTIKAVAVFDTVGSLGVPDVKPLGIKLHHSSKAEYSFVNTQVAPNVENAYQALALDEQRSAFVPTVWESPKGGKETHPVFNELRQCWFPGVHTSIGGGYQDTSIANLTLAWMMTQLSQYLDFDPEYLRRQIKQNQAFYTDKKVPENSPSRDYAMGLIKSSDVGLLNTVLGRVTRTPGTYQLTDPNTGEPLPERLQKTCEFMHPSVRWRMQQRGPGLAQTKTDTIGQGVYTPLALEKWKFFAAGEETPKGVAVEAMWAKKGKWVNEELSVYVVEDEVEQGSWEEILVGAYGKEAVAFVTGAA